MTTNIHDEYLPEKQEMIRQDILFANEKVEEEFPALKFLRRDNGKCSFDTCCLRSGKVTWSVTT